MREKDQNAGAPPGGSREAERPPSGEGKAPRRRWLPFVIGGGMVVIIVVLLVGGWQLSNADWFCSNVCHSVMYPYADVWAHSVHARVTCVECHMGRTSLLARLPLKLTHFRELYGIITGDYKTPLVATTLRPASESCELCHYPPQFFSDTVVQIQGHLNDRENTAESTWLILKTGGGLQREGLGRGIHWHIENQIYYYSTDEFQQNIPWLKVVDAQGHTTVYSDVEFQPPEGFPNPKDLRLMDCIDCHDRTGHAMLSPEQIVDNAITNGLISQDIPYIRRQALEVLAKEYTSSDEAFAGIQALDAWYAQNYAPAYPALKPAIQQAVQVLQTQYTQNFFPTQGYNWETYPENAAHMDFPGCFRCHDGKHLSDSGQVIRVECNLCHSIPEVVTGTTTPTMTVATGPEPASHLDTAWLHRHREVFDATCAFCHTVSNPGGTDNSSFCSNYACHGIAYRFANLDAPGLAERLGLKPPPSPPPAENPTYDGTIGPLLIDTCGRCHGTAAGLDVTSYATLLAGSSSGPVIVPGNPDQSKIVQVMQAGHFATLTGDNLDLLILWIANGAPEQ